MGNNSVGGGEILKYINTNNNNNMPSYLDEQLLKMFKMLPMLQVITILMIILLAIILIIKLLRIKTPFRGKSIVSEITYIDEIKRRDAAILRANKWLSLITRFIESTPLALDKSTKDYWEYNINRVGLKGPGGNRPLKPEELNALVSCIVIFMAILSIFIMLFINSALGFVMLVSSLILIRTIVKMVIRQTVKDKDNEIRENFGDLYRMLHYSLIDGAKTTLATALNSYSKTTTSKEMLRFVGTCMYYIDTYGEYEATRYISKDYREIPEVGKLMRLIRQSNEGADIKAELIGFRTEIMNEHKYRIEKRGEKIVRKAQASFNILMIVLLQAILSAMSIYMKDIGLIKGLFGN